MLLLNNNCLRFNFFCFFNNNPMNTNRLSVQLYFCYQSKTYISFKTFILRFNKNNTAINFLNQALRVLALARICSCTLNVLRKQTCLAIKWLRMCKRRSCHRLFFRQSQEHFKCILGLLDFTCASSCISFVMFFRSYSQPFYM